MSVSTYITLQKEVTNHPYQQKSYCVIHHNDKNNELGDAFRNSPHTPKAQKGRDNVDERFQYISWFQFKFDNLQFSILPRRKLESLWQMDR